MTIVDFQPLVQLGRGFTVDVTRFGITKSGQLTPIRIQNRWDDYAFVPDRLPPTWREDEKLWPIIAQAYGRVEALNQAGSLLAAPTLLFRPLQRREAITSNSIEGTHVTPGQLLLFEAQQPLAPEVVGARRQDWLDVLTYDQVLRRGYTLVQQGERIDRQLFCRLHAMLLESSRGRDKHPGEIRNIQVYIEGRRYIPPPPNDLAALLDDLEAFINDRRDYHPLVRAFVAHYQFEAIHPFEDGNGRIGRIVLALCLFKWLGHDYPWLYLSEFFDKNRKEYIQRLFAVSTHGEWQEWAEFCLRGVIEQAELALTCCKRLREIKEDYERRVGRLNARMNSIISRLISNPFVEAAQLARDLGCAYNTARGDIQKLIDAGILHEVPSGRPQWYCAREIFETAYLGQ